jgi:hypothetical protein
LFGHDQPTNDDVERFIEGPWEIDRREGLGTVHYQARAGVPGISGD